LIASPIAVMARQIAGAQSAEVGIEGCQHALVVQGTIARMRDRYDLLNGAASGPFSIAR